MQNRLHRFCSHLCKARYKAQARFERDQAGITPGSAPPKSVDPPIEVIYKRAAIIRSEIMQKTRDSPTVMYCDCCGKETNMVKSGTYRYTCQECWSYHQISQKRYADSRKKK